MLLRESHSCGDAAIQEESWIASSQAPRNDGEDRLYRKTPRN